MDVIGQKGMELDRNGWNWTEMDGLDGNGWNWTEMDGIGGVENKIPAK